MWAKFQVSIFIFIDSCRSLLTSLLSLLLFDLIALKFKTVVKDTEHSQIVDGHMVCKLCDMCAKWLGTLNMFKDTDQKDTILRVIAQ